MVGASVVSDGWMEESGLYSENEGCYCWNKSMLLCDMPGKLILRRVVTENLFLNILKIEPVNIH